MVSAKAIELIAHRLETSKDSYEKITAATNISKTTLSRIVQQHKASRYTLDMLAAYFEIGEQYHALVGDAENTCAFAAELTEELRNVRAYYEEKGVSLRRHYEEQISALREQNARQEQERNREREMQQTTYDKSTSYLKAECERLRAERDEARAQASTASAAAGNVAGKKHIVYWVLVGINALTAIALILSIVLH